MSFSFGAIYGGPEIRANDAIFLRTEAQIARFIKIKQDNVLCKNEGEINLVWHVPGTMFKPEFEGLRTGKFSKREKTLMVQAAVPSNLVYGEYPEEFIFGVIRQAITIAQTVFRSAKIPFAADEHLNFINTVERLWKSENKT